jgi:hypothetical protein
MIQEVLRIHAIPMIITLQNSLGGEKGINKRSRRKKFKKFSRQPLTLTDGIIIFFLEKR